MYREQYLSLWFLPDQNWDYRSESFNTAFKISQAREWSRDRQNQKPKTTPDLSLKKENNPEIEVITKGRYTTRLTPKEYLRVRSVD